ncbi:MAG: MaoC family dehydratase N-terminal domain-containing protein [Polyangiaceae bacterium]|nr:MaoC family dehydratase N-terminal domain-containing protein [Polyangiaceae bacterium]
MAIDTSLVGSSSPPHSFSYDYRTLALYALGIGAKRDELAYLYEGTQGGIVAYPTFAVVPAFAPSTEMLMKTGANLAMVVHGSQSIRLHSPLPASGTMETTATLRGIYDMKRLASIVIDTRSTLDNKPVFDTTWSILVRDAGGFGGPRPPSDDSPAIPKDRAPDFVVEELTSPEQALLYRLSGDVNPLHADPELAKSVGFPQGPILHGLCTYGFAGRAIVKHACGGDPKRLRSFAAQFRKPVWPGDTIVTQGFDLGGGKWAVSASVRERPDPVLTSAWAEIG